MADTDIRDTLRRAFEEAWLFVDGPLDDDLRLVDIDGLDSVSRVRLLLSVEELFSIEMSPKEQNAVATVGDLVALIEAKRGEK